MLDRLDSIEEKYEELTGQLSDPELLSDQSTYTKIARQHNELGSTTNWDRSSRSIANSKLSIAAYKKQTSCSKTKPMPRCSVSRKLS